MASSVQAETIIPRSAEARNIESLLTYDVSSYGSTNCDNLNAGGTYSYTVAVRFTFMPGVR